MYERKSHAFRICNSQPIPRRHVVVTIHTLLVDEWIFHKTIIIIEQPNPTD